MSKPRTRADTVELRDSFRGAGRLPLGRVSHEAAVGIRMGRRPSVARSTGGGRGGARPPALAVRLTPPTWDAFWRGYVDATKAAIDAGGQGPLRDGETVEQRAGNALRGAASETGKLATRDLLRIDPQAKVAAKAIGITDSPTFREWLRGVQPQLTEGGPRRASVS